MCVSSQVSLTWASCPLRADVAPGPEQCSWQLWWPGSCIQTELSRKVKESTNLYLNIRVFALRSSCVNVFLNIEVCTKFSKNISFKRKLLAPSLQDVLKTRDDWVQSLICMGAERRWILKRGHWPFSASMCVCGWKTVSVNKGVQICLRQWEISVQIEQALGGQISREVSLYSF